MAVEYHNVTEDESGQRLDNLLARLLKGTPRSLRYRLIRTGQVRVNGGRRKASYRIQAGDQVRLPPVGRSGSSNAQSRMRAGNRLMLDLLWEDRWLIALNKPAGMAVHGGTGLSGGVIEALRYSRAEENLELVHRLDRETSGCLLIARRRSALRGMHEQWRRSLVEKQYLALLSGSLDQDEYVVRVPLKRFAQRGGQRRVVVVHEGQGQTAETRFRVLARAPGASLVAVTLGSGRTHQIRVHAAHIGHPIIGDTRYGSSATNQYWHRYGLRRMYLHASSLRFRHPVEDTGIRISAPLPEELELLTARLFRPEWNGSPDNNESGPILHRGSHVAGS